MSILETVIRALIYVCFVVLGVYLVIWVLGALGIPLPAQVVKIVWIIAALLILLMLVRLLWPLASGWTLFPPRNPPPP